MAIPSVTHAESAADADASHRLMEKYRPTLVLARQSTPCGRGEPYAPIAVDEIFGQAGVTLRGVRSRSIVEAPERFELTRFGDEGYLDFPGRALKPGCSYEKWSDELAAQPTVYGRVTHDPDDRGRLVLQYWFFWVYNDWNDRHEGDWEMVQFVFDEPSVLAALEAEPAQVIAAQHEGGEVREWADVATWEDQPLLFPAVGSHATYFSANRWFGADAHSGFGCDDTRPPSQVIVPRLIAMPTDVPTTGPFSWLSWNGRWGEKQASFNNGPTGPTSKDQWSAPLKWMREQGRPSSIDLPALGTVVTDAFCATVERVSLASFEVFDRPWVSLTLAFAAIVAGVLLLRRTRWRGSTPTPIEQRRSLGQMWVNATKFSLQRWKSFTPLVVGIFAVDLVSAFLQRLAYRVTSAGELTSLESSRSAMSRGVIFAAGVMPRIPILVLVVCATAAIVDATTRGTERISLRSVLESFTRRGKFIPSLLFVLVVFVVPVYFAVLLWFIATWVLAPVCVDMAHPFHRAAELSRGHRLWVLSTAGSTLLIAGILGPAVGVVLLLSTPLHFEVLSTISAAFSAVMLPWSIVVLSYVRGHLTAGGRHA